MSLEKHMPTFLAIAGNIGAGKTCLAKKLSHHLGWELFNEPFQDNPYLELFYEDMKRWAFHTETSFLSHRLINHIEVLNRKTNIIQDRCIYEGAEIFVKNLYETGHLSKTDWDTYNHLYQSLIKTIAPPDLIVYIKSTPERCLANIKKRGRDLDKNVEPQYIHNLDRIYNEWHQNFKACPILIANADNCEFIANDDDFHQLIDKIELKLRK